MLLRSVSLVRFLVIRVSCLCLDDDLDDEIETRRFELSTVIADFQLGFPVSVS